MAKSVQPLPVPHPVSINEVCSECGEMWVLHPPNATLVDCVRLLKNKPTSTVVVSSPCHCWCHHYGSTTPYLPPIPIWVSNETTTSYPMLTSTTTSHNRIFAGM